jgi:hypothetical protein
MTLYIKVDIVQQNTMLNDTGYIKVEIVQQLKNALRQYENIEHRLIG